VTLPELGAESLEELDLIVSEFELLLARLPFQPEKPLVAGREIVA
jgi:hypothetical protein